jgi:excisionase family DNA binding protein
MVSDESQDPGKNEKQPLLSVNDVARYLNIHPEIVRRHIRSGALQAVKVGKLFRVSWEDLEKFKKRMDSPPPPATTTEMRMERRDFMQIHPRRAPPGIERSCLTDSIGDSDFSDSMILEDRIPPSRAMSISKPREEPYLDLTRLLADFEGKNVDISAKVDTRDYPFWEVTVFARTSEGEKIRKYITIPGVVHGTVAVIEEAPRKPGGHILLEEHFGEIRNFRNFVARVLQHYGTSPG